MLDQFKNTTEDEVDFERDISMIEEGKTGPNDLNNKLTFDKSGLRMNSVKLGLNNNQALLQMADKLNA